jgi:hypothetical protein
MRMPMRTRLSWSLLVLACTLVPFTAGAAELLVNPGAEEPVAFGTLPGWTEVSGTSWGQRSTNPEPFEGSAYFYAGAVAYGELRQDVSLSSFTAAIDAGARTPRPRPTRRASSSSTGTPGARCWRASTRATS